MKVCKLAEPALPESVIEKRIHQYDCHQTSLITQMKILFVMYVEKKLDIRLDDEKVTGAEKYNEVRRTVAGFIGSGDSSEIIFTKGATESINMVTYVMADGPLSESDNVVVTELEHHSNYLSWQHACKLSGAEFRVVLANSGGQLDMADRWIWRTARTKPSLWAGSTVKVTG